MILPWSCRRWGIGFARKTGKKKDGAPPGADQLDPLDSVDPVDSVRPPPGGASGIGPLPIRSPGIPQAPGFSQGPPVFSNLPVGGGVDLIEVIDIDGPPPGGTAVSGPPPILPRVPSLPSLPGLPRPPSARPQPVTIQPPIARPPVLVDRPPPSADPIPPPTQVIVVPVQPPGTVEIPPPANPVTKKLNPREALAAEVYRMLVASEPSKKVSDVTMLKAYQRQGGHPPGWPVWSGLREVSH